MRWTALVVLVPLVIGAVPCLSVAEPSVPKTEPQDVFPSAVAVYATSEDATRWGPEGERDVEVLRRPSVAFSDELSAAQMPERQNWWPVLYSLIIPGTGELSMGYEKRGVALMIAEVVAWTGYFRNHDQGLDLRDEYETFADANWSQPKWIDEHPDVYPALSGITSLDDLEEIGRVKGGSGDWPGYIPWVSRGEDKQHYYENIGKYDWYISGWADWDPDLQLHETALRDQYRATRQASNDNLDTANRFVYLSIAARVFSLVETTLLVRRSRNSYDEQYSQVGNHWRFQAQPEGFRGAVVSLEYRFK